MAFLHELIVSGLIVLGATFALIGSFGLLKLPDVMTRLHAPTKATTLGVGSALIASMVFFLGRGEGPSIHELLISLFLFLTAPITAHFLAKAYLHSERRKGPREDLSTPDNSPWATFSQSPGED